MEKVKRLYGKPQGVVRNIRTSILCGSVSEVSVGGNTNKPFDTRMRNMEKDSSLSID